MEEMIPVYLTETQIRGLIGLFEMDFIPFVRRHIEIENMSYLADMVGIWQNLKHTVTEGHHGE